MLGEGAIRGLAVFMTVFSSRRIAALYVPLVLVAACVPAQAQAVRPPGNIPETREAVPLQRVQDAAGQNVRIDRLEGQIRNLTGQIEQLQFQNRKLEEQTRKQQADMEFRFQELGGKPGAPPKRVDATGAPPPVPTAPAPALTNGQKPPRVVTQGDAFDPNARPNAPGAPRPLGGTPLPGPTTILPGAPLPSGPLEADLGPDPLNTPVQLGVTHAGGNSGIEPLNPGGAPLVPVAPVPVASVPVAATPIAPGLAIPGAPPQPPQDDYQLALASLKQGQYEVAEQGLRSFILKNPRSHRVPDATYYLGETFFQRGRHREAAEQYLKVSTDFSGSTRAPEGLLRLGMSLKAMGAGEQACATFGEIARKYPAAPIAVRKGAEREIARNKC